MILFINIGRFGVGSLYAYLTCGACASCGSRGQDRTCPSWQSNLPSPGASPSWQSRTSSPTRCDPTCSSSAPNAQGHQESCRQCHATPAHGYPRGVHTSCHVRGTCHLHACEYASFELEVVIEYYILFKREKI